MEARTQHPGAGVLTESARPRFVGIDLGTTNSAVASAADAGPVQRFDIPQVVAAGEAGRQATLPSCVYFPTADELAAGQLPAPWASDPVAGVFARDHGGLVPARQIASAKSWLSNAAVDRSAALLPWMDDAPRRLSPVDASARLLEHLRTAWNHDHAGDAEAALERQSVVLTVPASFDEEARELTLAAAAAAGLPAVTLLEEPLAALYAWIAANPRRIGAALAPGALVLVCDVGGGTTDFSLVRTAAEADALVFERIAIGEHLLLGGDNLDIALAAAIEEQLGGAARLSLAQRQTLRRKCSAAKEQLLSESGPDRLPITLLGTGRGVVGGHLTTALSRADVVRVLCDGFLPLTTAADLPSRSRRAGVRGRGLPDESDPAITRHLAAFLTRAAAGGGGLAAPDAVLFNGGFFTPGIARRRVLDALEAWSGRRPAVLENARPEASVAVGAAFYARLRSRPETARRWLIRAGAPRAYYIGVAAESAGAAVCVMPRGTEEGTRFALDRTFSVVANQPSSFTLVSSVSRTDPLGAVVTLEDDDEVHRHAPLVTALRYGRRSRRVPIAVRIAAAYTETGTLELWCESAESEHRWRLSFSLRGAGPEMADEAEAAAPAAPLAIVVSDEAITAARSLVAAAFGVNTGAAAPAELTAALEQTLGHGKASWPLGVLRELADALLEHADGRRRDAAHEARWLNLAGFCARPGFGAPADPWRIGELRKVYAGGLIFPRIVQCQVEWLVLWQRVSGGFTSGQQRELAGRVAAQLGIGQKKPARLNAQVERDAWRLLAGLERVEAAERVRIGDRLAELARRDPRAGWRVAALGRVGARVPLYGPLNAVVPGAAAARWINLLLGARELTPDIAAAVVSIGELTGDPARDLPAAVRESAARPLDAAGAPADVVAGLRVIRPADRTAGWDASGESLPEGLRLETSSGGSGREAAPRRQGG